MKKYMFLKAIVVTYAFFVCTLIAQAQPVIEWADYYTDYWYNYPFKQEANGHHFVVCGYVEGSVTVKVTDGNVGPIDIDGGPWYCRFVEDDGFVRDFLTIIADDGINPEVRRDTHSLDKILEMNKATGIIFSDNSTSPIVSWNKDKYVTRYYLRVIDNQDKEIHRSPPLDQPEYKIPNNVMTVGHTYYFRLLNQNYDKCDVYEWGSCIENRSSTWVKFSPSEFNPCILGARILEVDDDEIEVAPPPGYSPWDILDGRITKIAGNAVYIPASDVDSDDDDGVELEFEDLDNELEEGVEVCVELDLADGAFTCEVCGSGSDDDDDDDDDDD